MLAGTGEVAGFLAKRGERDWIAFTAKKGDKLTIDLVAERVGASGDFYFSVRDGKDPKKDLSGEQDDDAEIAADFAELAKRLRAEEETITQELLDVQGSPTDVGGYYRPDADKAAEVMRPSKTFNEALDSL